MIELNEHSTHEDVLAAVKEGRSHDTIILVNDDTKDNKIELEHVDYLHDRCNTIRDDVLIDLEAWIVKETHQSWYRGKEIVHYYAVIDKTIGALYGGEGVVYVERYFVDSNEKDDIDIAIETIKRECVPVRIGFQEQ